MFAKICPCFGLVLAAHIRWKPYILVVSSPGQCGLLSALCWWWAAYKLVLPWRGAAAAPTYFASYFLLQPVPTPPRLFSRLPASADRTGGARGGSTSMWASLSSARQWPSAGWMGRMGSCALATSASCDSATELISRSEWQFCETTLVSSVKVYFQKVSIEQPSSTSSCRKPYFSCTTIHRTEYF